MAKLYILDSTQMQTGERPKTPKQKTKFWRRTCIILAILIILENVVLLHGWSK